jgi:MFS family permease
MSPSLILVGISLFTWGIGEGMFFYFVPLYLQDLGADAISIGSVFSWFGFVMMVAHIPAGYLADRIGRRPVIRMAWISGMVSTWVMALAPSLRPFIVGYVMYGVTGFVMAPLFSYVTAARGNLSAGRAMTLVSAVYNLGAVIGPVSGGWIGEQFSLRAIFLISACIFVISTGIIFALKPQPRDVIEGDESENNLFRNTRFLSFLFEGDESENNLFRNTRFLSFLFVVFIVIFATYLPQPLSPNFLQNERGITLGQMGFIGSMGSLGNVVFNLVLGRLSPQLGFVLGQACVALFALLLWKGTGQPWYMLGFFLMGGFRAARMLAMAQIRLLIHQAQMGLAYGMSETAGALALILSPPLAGYLYDRDPASVYPVSLILIGIGVIISLILIPREARVPEYSLKSR